jgi:hypothetical protein
MSASAQHATAEWPFRVDKRPSVAGVEHPASSVSTPCPTTPEPQRPARPHALEQGQAESPLKLREIRAIRIRPQLANQLRDLALFNPAIDSKLRGCDMVDRRGRDVAHGGTVAHRTIVLQHETQQPV